MKIPKKQENMIQNFSIRNYKIFKDEVELSLLATKSKELEDFYVVKPFNNKRVLRAAFIYGPNASGKSTIVEALAFLKNLVTRPFNSKEETFEDLKPFLGDSKAREMNTQFKITFVSSGCLYSYTVELNKHYIAKEELKVTRTVNKRSRTYVVYRRTTDSKKKIAKVNFGKSLGLTKDQEASLTHNTLWNNTVLGGYLKTNLAIEDLDNVVNWFQYKLILSFPTDITTLIIPGILKSDRHNVRKKRLLAFLNKADFSIKDMRIKRASEDSLKGFWKQLWESLQDSSNQDIAKTNLPLLTFLLDKLYIVHGPRGSQHGEEALFELPIEEESRGTVKFLSLASLLLLLQEEGALVVDEIETSLHPDLVEHFIKEFVLLGGNTQLIATTHYRELLKNTELFRKDVLWFTEPTEDGSAELYSLRDFDSREIKNLTSIYNAYKIGKLGGVPNL
ncbi:AAA family ATPase [Thermosulfidibacter takaii]|nr:ATP-binding protein [Thermosulfidibacter takaii]